MPPNQTQYIAILGNIWDRKRMRFGSFKNLINEMGLQISYIYYICVKKISQQITYNGWYAIKPLET